MSYGMGGVLLATGTSTEPISGKWKKKSSIVKQRKGASAVTAQSIGKRTTFARSADVFWDSFLSVMHVINTRWKSIQNGWLDFLMAREVALLH